MIRLTHLLFRLTRAITSAANGLFDLLLSPFASRPALGMVFISVLTAVWALLLFKAVTPQTRLAEKRDQLFGHLYEMGLYPNHLKVLGRIQVDLARVNLQYLAFTLPALLVLALPMLLTLGQLESRYAQRPPKIGEDIVLTMRVSESRRVDLQDVVLDLSPALEVVAGPVRHADSGTLSWRLKALENGLHDLRFSMAGQSIGSGRLPVGGGLPRLHEKNETSAWGVLLHPGALDLLDLSHSSDLRDLNIQWPSRKTKYLGLELNWLVAFMGLSMVAGLLAKDLLKVSL